MWRAVGRGLDKDTSGVMVYAKSRIAAARLSAQKQTGEFQKVYFALVKGENEGERSKYYLSHCSLYPEVKLKMQVQEGGDLPVPSMRCWKKEKARLS